MLYKEDRWQKTWRVVTTTTILGVSFLPAHAFVALSLAKLVERNSAIALITTVTTPSSTNIVTMPLTVSANPVTVAVTATAAPALAIPDLGTSAVDPQAPKWNIAEANAAYTPAIIFAKRSTATISGQSGVFIGIVGAVGTTSLRI